MDPDDEVTLWWSRTGELFTREDLDPSSRTGLAVVRLVDRAPSKGSSHEADFLTYCSEGPRLRAPGAGCAMMVGSVALLVLRVSCHA